ncbi:hypothetical protein [Sporosarcina sp. ITBMC105]
MPTGKGQAFDQAKQLNTQLKEEKQRTKALKKDLKKKEKVLAETAALLLLRKKAQAIWGTTRKNDQPFKSRTHCRINQEANQNGARLANACQELQISVRTYER